MRMTVLELTGWSAESPMATVGSDLLWHASPKGSYQSVRRPH